MNIIKILFDRVKNENLLIKIWDFTVMIFWGLLVVIGVCFAAMSLMDIFVCFGDEWAMDDVILAVFIGVLGVFIGLITKYIFYTNFYYYKFKYRQKYIMTSKEKDLIKNNFDNKIVYNINNEFGINEDLSFTLESNYNYRIHSIITNTEEVYSSKKAKKEVSLIGFIKNNISKILTIRFNLPWRKIWIFLLYDNKNQYYSKINVVYLLISITLGNFFGLFIYFLYRLFLIKKRKLKLPNVVFKDTEDYFENTVFAIVQTIILIVPIFFLFPIIFSLIAIYNSFKVMESVNQGDFFNAKNNALIAIKCSRWIILFNNLILMFLILLIILK